MNNRNIKPISPFILFCQKVIPLAFDESMSYYECLCALTNYLYNEVTPAINNNADAVTELQTYVANYFKNLDVQDEINNKLDEMAESGELEQIIAEYLETKAIYGFDNVGDMVASTNLINGSYARTLGYYSKNDGGSGLYKIRNVTNEDVVDSGSIIAMSDNTLIAELITNGNISLKQFGAKGDGTTDDSTFIQNAINYFINNDVTLISDESTYYVTNSIVINKLDNLYNYKYIDFSKAKFITDQNINVFDVTMPWLDLKINSIENTGTAYTQGSGIILRGKNWYDNININTIIYFNKGFYVYLNLEGTSGMMYSNITLKHLNNENNIYINRNGSYVNENKFNLGLLGGAVNDSNSRGIYVINDVENPDNLEFNGNVFNNMRFERVGKPIHLEHCYASTFKNISIMERPYSDLHIKLIDCKNMIFEGNSTGYLNLASYIEDDYSIEDANINDWKSNANIYKLYVGNFLLLEAPNAIVAKEFTYVNNKVVYLDANRKNGRFDYKETTTTGDNNFDLGNFPTNYLTVVAGTGNAIISMPIQYSLYNSGYDEIIINIGSLLNNNKVVIKDYLGNIVFDSSNYTFTKGAGINKKFMLKKTGYNNFIVINI